MAIAIFGSINMDLVVRTRRFPSPGETLFGSTFFTAPGGKGANQAVACARLGAATIMLGRVGSDLFGDALLDSLNMNQVDTHLVQKDKNHPTGTALITITDEAENTIIVVSGANHAVNNTDIASLESVLGQVKLLLLQLEIPIPMVVAAARAARERGVRVILDPAPAQELPNELFGLVDYITPNETEAAILSGFSLQDRDSIQEAARIFHGRGTSHVIIKMGSKGAYWSGPDGSGYLPIYPVKAVDTVAAGDAFNGAFAVALDEGLPEFEALQWGMAGGALSTTKHGAQPSLPFRQEILSMIQSSK